MAWNSNDILWQDADLIVVAKPPGLPSQATVDPHRPHLHQLVTHYLTEQGEPGVVTLIHRLDRDTSGCVLLCKTPSLNKAMAEQFRQHVVTKTYVALIAVGEARPQTEWTVKNHLRKIAAREARMHSVRAGGDFAETNFILIGSAPEAAAVRAQPRTGRTHQIRVHLSEGGTPILGDDLYAPPQVQRLAPRLMLHALCLEFIHPRSAQAMKVVCPLPPDFKECAARLKVPLAQD